MNRRPPRGLGEVALAAARAGAAAVTEVLALGLVAARYKGTDGELVTEADERAERAIMAALRAVRPDDALCGEETGEYPGTSGVWWWIDPVDGTTNLVHGWPDYAVSVGAEWEGRYVAGAICRPAYQDWIAGDQHGVRTSGGRSGLGTADTLAHALVGFTPDQHPLRCATSMALVSEVLKAARDIRRTGSIACDLRAVATGELDAAIITFDPYRMDVAAGAALVTAAGGVYRQVRTPGGVIVTLAANPVIAAALTDLFTSTRVG